MTRDSPPPEGEQQQRRRRDSQGQLDPCLPTGSLTADQRGTREAYPHHRPLAGVECRSQGGEGCPRDRHPRNERPWPVHGMQYTAVPKGESISVAHRHSDGGRPIGHSGETKPGAII
jgi:hypothetical protein